MKYKPDEYHALREIIWLNSRQREKAVLFNTLGGGHGPSSRPNPHAATYCGSCRDVRKVRLTVSPFGAEIYTSSTNKKVECLQAECGACGNGWAVFAIGTVLHRKAPKRK